MTWLPADHSRNTKPTGSGYEDTPGREPMADLVKRVDGRSTPAQMKQLHLAQGAVRQAARGVVNELGSSKRLGFTLPNDTDLMAEFGRGLPSRARTRLLEFIAEVRPAIEDGSFGPADEAARHFAFTVGQELAESGWAPSPRDTDDDDVAADVASIDRG